MSVPFPGGGGEVLDLTSISGLRACTALAYLMPGMIVTIADGAQRKRMQAGFPSDRYVQIHVADLRLSVARSIADASTKHLDALLEFPVLGSDCHVFSATSGVEHLVDGVWKMTTNGAVTYVTSSVATPTEVKAAHAVLESTHGLSVAITPEPLLAILMLYVDVEPTAPHPDKLEAVVVDVLKGVAFPSHRSNGPISTLEPS